MSEEYRWDNPECEPADRPIYDEQTELLTCTHCGYTSKTMESNETEEIHHE
jgi:Zn ribbon nucleic-acid-binding protein